jgi:tetratricopeptide (TPR) repeat protein
MKGMLLKHKLAPCTAILIILCGLNVSGDEIFDQAYRMMEQGKPAQALALYEKALAANPDSADIWQEYTICLRKLKRFQKALQAGWRTLELGNESEGTTFTILTDSNDAAFLADKLDAVRSISYMK